MSSGEFHVEGGIPCRGGVPCQGGNSMSREEFRVEGGIPCRGVNSMTRGEFRFEGVIVDTQLYILLKKILTSVFTINIGVFLFFSKML